MSPADAATPIHLATKADNVAIAELLIAARCSVLKSTARDKQTPLMVAVKNQNIDFVRLLLDNNANMDALAADGATPMFMAAERGNTCIVRALLERGASCENAGAHTSMAHPPRTPSTPLQAALTHGHHDMVALLGQHGANMNRVSFFPEVDMHLAPIHKCCLDNEGQVNADVITLLCNLGADVNLKCESDPHRGHTPLYMAVDRQNLKLVQLLTSLGADVEVTEDDLRHTPLSHAVQKNNCAIAQCLISSNANVNHVIDPASTRICMVNIAAHGGHESMLRVLLEAGADANSMAKDGAFPLYLAAQNGHLGAVKCLVDHGAAASADGKSMPVPGARPGPPAGAGLDRQLPAGTTGCSPLYVASQNGFAAIVDYLLWCGASPNLRRLSADGSGSLYVACYQGHVKVVATLLHHGAEINQTNNDGNTPLYIAVHQAAQTGASRKHVDVVRLLLKRNADMNLFSASAQSPLSVAARGATLPGGVPRSPNIAVMRLLLDQGAQVGKIARPIRAAAAGSKTGAAMVLAAADLALGQEPHGSAATTEDATDCAREAGKAGRKRNGKAPARYGATPADQWNPGTPEDLPIHGTLGGHAADTTCAIVERGAAGNPRLRARAEPGVQLVPKRSRLASDDFSKSRPNHDAEAMLRSAKAGGTGRRQIRTSVHDVLTTLDDVGVPEPGSADVVGRRPKGMPALESGITAQECLRKERAALGEAAGPAGPAEVNAGPAVSEDPVEACLNGLVAALGFALNTSPHQTQPDLSNWLQACKVLVAYGAHMHDDQVQGFLAQMHYHYGSADIMEELRGFHERTQDMPRLEVAVRLRDADAIKAMLRYGRADPVVDMVSPTNALGVVFDTTQAYRLDFDGDGHGGVVPWRLHKKHREAREAAVLYLVHQMMEPRWAPSRHWLYVKSFRDVTHTVLCLHERLWARHMAARSRARQRRAALASCPGTGTAAGAAGMRGGAPAAGRALPMLPVGIWFHILEHAIVRTPPTPATAEGVLVPDEWGSGPFSQDYVASLRRLSAAQGLIDLDASIH